MTSFNYTTAGQQVIFGAGSLAQLGQALDTLGCRRLLLCTIRRFQREGLVDRLHDQLGRRLAAEYAQVQPHVQRHQVEEALALAAHHDVDAVIGLGGGSPIGMAKAVSLALEEQRTGRPARASSPLEQPLVPVIAIPTTYAGSELTPIYGVTHHEDGARRKATVTDLKVTPKVALYDPELTLSLPAEMTASSGINALAHCVEAVYSITRNPLSTAAALQGVGHIFEALPRAVASGDDVDARTQLQLGGYLAATALTMAKIGLHHGLCHVLGGTAGVPHGAANAIMLPHAMRYNADVTARQQAMVAGAMGLSGDSDGELAERAALAVTSLVGQIGLPQRLRDVGVAETELPRLAQLALGSRAVQNNPKPIGDATEVEAVFRAAW